MLHVYQLFFPVSILFSSPHSSYKLQFNLGFICPKNCLGFSLRTAQAILDVIWQSVGTAWIFQMLEKWFHIQIFCTIMQLLELMILNLHLKMSILDLHRCSLDFSIVLSIDQSNEGCQINSFFILAKINYHL